MKSKLLLTAFAATFSLGAPLAAQMTVPANPATSAVQGGNFAVEPNHTRVQFSVMHMGFTEWYGDFTGVSGKLKLDPRRLANAQVEIDIPVASVSTTNTKLDGELRSADWLDAARYPTMHFSSSRIVRVGERGARIYGNFTLHGVTRPVMLNASFVGGGANPMSKAYTLGFNATTQIKRSDYGVATYVPLVGDQVDIRISAAFERQP